MRRVIYKKFVDGATIEKEGLFHGVFNSWAYADGAGLITVPMALIEAEDCRLMEVSPSLIRFIDTPEIEQLVEFAKAAMQGLLSNSRIINIHAEDSSTWVSEHAIMQAKSLIAELKKQSL